VDGRTKKNAWKSLREIPAKSEESEEMSGALAERGFRFVGPTICYAFMQATGMVNDHTVDCFRHAALAGRARGRVKRAPAAARPRAAAARRRA